MRIVALLRHLQADILDTIEDPQANEQTTHQDGSADNRRVLLRKSLTTGINRFICEKWPYLDKVAASYKTAMGTLAHTGSLHGFRGPDALSCSGYSIRTQIAILGWLSWSSKLTFLNESTGVADYAGFEKRSAECINFDGCTWEDILPMNRDYRRDLNRYARFSGWDRAKHGPGATADYYRGWDKWLALDGPTRPLIRMTSVPKDRNKRRLIGIEHARQQFQQQAVADCLRRTEWFQRWVNLEDQEQHIRFAAQGETKVTVDLSDASDRISLSLVDYLLPEWSDLIRQTSSAFYELPKGAGSGRLGMVATMGCGFCFELETLVFHIVASLAGRIYDDDLRGVVLPLAHYASRCRVYGDDIIIPQQWYPTFQDLALKLGWVISEHKTCLTADFLETCGTYITPSFTVKRLCPTLMTADRGGVLTELCWNSESERLDSAMAFHRAGFPRTARAIARPVVDRLKFRWNQNLQRIECKLHSCVSDTRVLNVTEEIRLLAYWVSGLSDQDSEPIDSDCYRRTWVPMRDYVDVMRPSFTPQ